jgi:2,5-diketo-D-gluconate reductase A
MRMNLPPAPSVLLPNGVSMPRLGLGTWPMNDIEAMIAVEAALNMGYRLIDTAESYQNERGVGEGLRRSGLVVRRCSSPASSAVSGTAWKASGRHAKTV